MMSFAAPPEVDVPAHLRPNPEACPAEWHQAHERFLAYVGGPEFPCTGARSALNRQSYRFALFDELGTRDAAGPVCDALYRFIEDFPDPGLKPVTFVAAFSTTSSSEALFESLLWGQLQAMHEIDRQYHGWDPAVSSDPQDPDFSLSIGGTGFFVVGLHPHASRWSRRAPTDTLVFNLHSQFVAMREAGKYDSMERVVRQRDTELQGSINPVLARHGEASEAMQYSGRSVSAGWACPFHPAVRP